MEFIKHANWRARDPSGRGCCRKLHRGITWAPEKEVMIVLLLFLQKQSLAFAVYLFGIGTLHTGPGLKKKHM
jgi:hypothetical protein